MVFPVMRWNNPIKQDKFNKRCNSLIGYYEKKKKLKFCTAQPQCLCITNFCFVVWITSILEISV